MGTPFFLYSETTQRNQPEELRVVEKVFGARNVSTQIFDIPKGSIVIPRFRAIPFGKELEQEIVAHGSETVNSYLQHRNIANLNTWVGLLDGLTAPAFGVDDIPYLPEGEWFVKGETNSIKNRWFDCCYAPTTRDLTRVVRNNLLDSYVGSQTIIIRPYQKFRQIGAAVDGRPVFNEKRCFVLNGEVVSVGDYWSTFPEFAVDSQDDTVFWDVLNEAVRLTEHLATFYVIDLAEFEDGSWQVVELNDATMSGLSDNDPTLLWSAVHQRLTSL